MLSNLNLYFRRFLGALALLALPVAEYAFLRWFLHSPLALRIGWGNWLTDFDLLIPVPAAFLTFVLMQGAAPRLALQKRALVVHLAAFLFFVALCLSFTRFPLYQSGAGLALFWISALACLGTAFTVWVPFNYYFTRENILLGAYCSSIGTATVLVTHGFRIFWKQIGMAVASGMNLLFDTMSLPIHSWFTKGGIRISHPELNLHVGHNCGGMDGFFLASCTLVFLAIKFRGQLRPLHYLGLTLFGWGTLFLLNVFRVASLFALGLAFKRLWGYEVGVNLLMGMFHTYAGWVFYFFGIYQIGSLAYFLAHRAPAKHRVGTNQPALVSH